MIARDEVARPSGRASEGVRVLTVDDWGSLLPLDQGKAKIRPIVWQGMGARLRTLNHLQFEAGGRTAELCHAGEAVYYVIEGEVTATAVGSDQNQVIELDAGGMLHVMPGERYYFQASSPAVLIGGPCPVDDEAAAPEGEVVG